MLELCANVSFIFGLVVFRIISSCYFFYYFSCSFFPFSTFTLLVALATSFALMDSEHNYVPPSPEDSSSAATDRDTVSSTPTSGAPDALEHLTREQCSRILNLPYGAVEAYKPKMW